MAIATENAHVELAKFIVGQASSIYLTIGKTSEWSNENSPPQPQEEATQLTETIGYKQASKVALVRPAESPKDDDKDKISFGNRSWVEVTESNAISEGARYIYLEAEIVGDELPLGEYRQVGFVMGLDAKTSKQNLEPSEVNDPGTLLFYDNKQYQNRTAQTTVKERFIIEA